MEKHQTKAAGFFVTGFGIIVLAISAVTTFTFFSTFFVGIFPVDMLGKFIASLFAGAAGVILFDLGVPFWLNTFLKHAETAEQRGVSLLMIIFCFVGAATASIAQLAISATGIMAIEAQTLATISNVSVIAVIAGVVVNFGSHTAYTRFSLESKRRVQEANWRDKEQEALDEQRELLGDLVVQKTKEKLSEQADELADIQTDRIVTTYRQKEQARFANGSPQTRVSKPTGQPKREQEAVYLNGNGNPTQGNGTH